MLSRRYRLSFNAAQLLRNRFHRRKFSAELLQLITRFADLLLEPEEEGGQPILRLLPIPGELILMRGRRPRGSIKR